MEEEKNQLSLEQSLIENFRRYINVLTCLLVISQAIFSFITILAFVYFLAKI